MTKILILGGNSYIGQSIYHSLKDKYQITSLTRQELDITNLEDLKNTLKKDNYDYIINTAIKGGRRIKPDSAQDFYDNIIAQENLMICKDLYKYLIIFGSGIEFDRKGDIYLRKEGEFNSVSTEYYGLSKYVNTQRAKYENYIINLRIFAVFSHLEHEHRFLKTNIKKYINHQGITIFDDQFYDFFYIKDLITIIDHFIQNPPNSATEINCCYKEKLTLSDTCGIINSLEDYKVPVIVESKTGRNYCGDGSKLEKLGLKFVGLENGIKETYKELLNGK